MDTLKYNSSSQVILLARPADSLHYSVLHALTSQNMDCQVCRNVFEVTAYFEMNPCGSLTFLITRPAMISSHIAEYIQNHRSSICFIGCLDSGENPADTAFAPAIQLGMIMPASTGHIGCLIQTIQGVMERVRSSFAVPPQKNISQQLQGVLSADEINALLGTVK